PSWTAAKCRTTAHPRPRNTCASGPKNSAAHQRRNLEMARGAASARREHIDWLAARRRRPEVTLSMVHRLLLLFVILAGTGLEGHAQATLFSGPQVGEKLLPFKVRGFFGDDAGKELDFVTQAAGKPIVLVFIHDCNRKSL